jgi:hypothetical protein
MPSARLTTNPNDGVACDNDGCRRKRNKIEALRLEDSNAIVDVRQEVSRIQIVDGKEAVVESRVLQTET